MVTLLLLQKQAHLQDGTIQRDLPGVWTQPRHLRQALLHDAGEARLAERAPRLDMAPVHDAGEAKPAARHAATSAAAAVRRTVACKRQGAGWDPCSSVWHHAWT